MPVAKFSSILTPSNFPSHHHNGGVQGLKTKATSETVIPKLKVLR